MFSSDCSVKKWYDNKLRKRLNPTFVELMVFMAQQCCMLNEVELFTIFIIISMSPYMDGCEYFMI